MINYVLVMNIFTEYIKRKDVHLAFDNYYFPGKLSLRETIDSVPSVDVIERKKGKWIDPADPICYKCTACGNYANQGYGLDEPIFWNYCPNCGADMRDKVV